MNTAINNIKKSFNLGMFFIFSETTKGKAEASEHIPRVMSYYVSVDDIMSGVGIMRYYFQLIYTRTCEQDNVCISALLINMFIA